MPTAAGTFAFTATVTDAAKSTASASVSITIAASLTITTTSLPDAAAGVAYNQQLVATGNTGTVTWSLASGSLPQGISLNSAGVLSGSPTQGGTFSFGVMARDSAQSVVATLSLTVKLQAIPQLSITGLPATVPAAQQLTVGVSASAAYPVDLIGQLNLSVAADPAIGVTDPNVQFASGGTTISFRIPANSTQAVFTQPAAFQTGTVAGTISLSVDSVQAGGVTQPGRAALASGVLNKSVPAIVGTPSVVRTSGGIQVTLSAYSTTREITGAVFTFQGASAPSAPISVPLSTLFSGWFASAASLNFGSQFQLVQPFGVTGSTSQVAGLTITLTNSVGSSPAISVNF